MMALLFLLTATALGTPPQWSGVDLASIPEVTDVSQGPNGPRASLAGGGLIRVHIAPTELAAETAFDGEHRTAATTWPPPQTALPGDQAAGDGTSLLLVRDRNVVVFVRDLNGKADQLAESVRARLTHE
jgi:hypothetical protein